MAVKVKLCGLADVDAMRGAGAARPDAIGLVMAPSVRQVSPALADELLGWVPRGVQRWAVFRRPDPAVLAEIGHLPFTGVQGDGDWDGAGLPGGWAFLPVFRDGPDLAELVHAAGFDGRGRAIDGLIGAFLVDGPVGGGAGVLADHERCAEVARLGPMVLAGGLNPDNVGEAVRRVRPWAVDVSSGTEASPGRKDPAKLLQFAERARGA